MSAARQALLNVVNSEPLVEPGSQNKAPCQSVEVFEIVAAHNGLHELGECETAKKAARGDIENAITCYAELAASIRAEAPWQSKCGWEVISAGGLEQCQRHADARNYFTGRAAAELPKPSSFPDDRRTSSTPTCRAGYAALLTRAGSCRPSVAIGRRRTWFTGVQAIRGGQIDRKDVSYQGTASTRITRAPRTVRYT